MLPPGLIKVSKSKLINLPPLSRIETHALLNDGQKSRPYKLRDGEKFVSHMSRSPSPRREPSALKKCFSESAETTQEKRKEARIGVMTDAEEGSSKQVSIPVEDQISDIKEYEQDDLEARMPQEKASLKGSVRAEDQILRLSIGGSSYRIRTRSILKYGPTTLLGRLCRMDHEHRRQWADGYFEDSDEYFFERVPRYFDPIYDFYAAGKLHVPKDLCFEKFMSELRFWAVSKAKMDDCCSPFAQYCLMRKLPTDHPEKDHFIGLRCAKVRRRLWLVLEGHSNSKWWKFFEVTSTSFVVLSITALIMGSIPEFQVPGNMLSDGTPPTPAATYPTYPKVAGYTVSTTTVIKEGEDMRPEMVEHPVFNYVENICVIYFTLEYVLRLWVAPRKLAFVKEFLNIIDLLAITPFIFEIILILVGISGDKVRKVRWAFLTVRLLRVLRVVRIAKLGRFSPGLANFALTLRKSKKQMQMVFIVMLTVMIFFSTLVYFLERDEPNTTFTSIPAAFWWCLFSQTKWVPQTAAGKLVGGGAIVCGAMVLALPVTIMINNFLTVVKLREEKVIKKYAQQRGDQV
ncbi:unnamed protein product [Bursaphelenchus xylophilus]|uniref:(pine wood nematode) hypothetical protein n=1 Tax=Bursaphelenchus xylophilus TaxID=6326 RepID=A0A1I7S3P4_BURXY|nr:unnamed protein product [Bursaphelenchus xylophilus]CAG9116444.1 unnamed protein product [Bursaphelenchus xylophilus]